MVVSKLKNGNTAINKKYTIIIKNKNAMKNKVSYQTGLQKTKRATTKLKFALVICIVISIVKVHLLAMGQFQQESISNIKSKYLHNNKTVSIEVESALGSLLESDNLEFNQA